LHPDAYLTRLTVDQQGKRGDPIPGPSRQALLDAGVELIETEKPSFVVEGMALVTGQVARTNNFETGTPRHSAFRDGVLTPDPLICDDQGLVINVRDRGLVVLSGCGHAGIVNTVHHAQALTGVQKVHAVIGGFHLGPTDFHDRIKPVVDALLALEPAIISPAHCAGHSAASAIYRERPEAFVQNMVGTRITIGGG
ncbi:MAG: MBL fold metallo-hydrolase, partial [Chloroflexi bacterium]|nr:MBL fold metallo-hydrolase [Chloroflexota bacterium]